MSGRLFKPKAKVVVTSLANAPAFFGVPLVANTIEIEDLRVQLKVEKHIDKEPNTCEITISNCNEQTRAFLESKPLFAQLLVGYDDDGYRHLFSGDVRRAWSEINGTDWETHLQLADGDRAFRYARVSRSYKKGASVVTALQETAAALGLRVDASVLASPDLQAQFASGTVLQGAAADEMTRLLAPYGYHWSVQDSKLVILKDGDVRPDRAIVISQDTGMIGSPSYTTPEKQGKPAALDVKMLMYPELTPGGQIQVQARAVNGIFRVERIVHTGDTHGTDDHWITEIQAKPRR